MPFKNQRLAGKPERCLEIPLSNRDRPVSENEFLPETGFAELEVHRRNAQAAELEEPPLLVVGAVVGSINPDRPILDPYIRARAQAAREWHRVERVLRRRIPHNIVFGQIGAVQGKK